MSIFNKKGDSERQTGNYATKADVILQRQAELSDKLDKLLAGTGSAKETAYIGTQSGSILQKLLEENAQLKNEIKYVSAQCESIFVKLSSMITSLEEKMMKYVVGYSKPAEGEEMPAVKAHVDYDELAERLADKFVEKELISALDYEDIAKRVAECMPQEVIPADYIASKIADQIVIPPAVVGSADGTPVELSAQIDTDALADDIARKVGALYPNDFDIVVDDEGCRPLAEAVADKLDYDGIAKKLAEKSGYDELAAADAEAVDTDELARLVSEKLVASGVNEDVIADKTAAALSNVMPEVDSDEIADKVAAAVLASVPATEIDYDAIINGVAEKINDERTQTVQSAETVPLDDDFDIVIDDDGLKKITDGVSESVAKSNEQTLGELDSKLAEIKEAVAGISAAALVTEEDKYAKDVVEINRKIDDLTGRIDELLMPEEVDDEEYVGEYDNDIAEIKEEMAEINRQLEEIKGMLAGGAAAAVAAAQPAEESESDEAEEEPALVTVSDIVDENAVEEEPADEVMENIFDDVDEQTAEGEAQPDGELAEGGVDFANMMKYNRSFIARIIQSSDDVKRYYGQIKNAMLAYKKVNSSVAWGAERFNKGRETIAKLKIRGKTLCLYLNLDPNEYKTSVYHQVDVSGNKSMHGTPMMVKIKSPLGVKKAIRLIDDMLAKRNGEKRNIQERDYAAMYPYESMEELIEDGLVKDVSKNK